MEPFTARQRVLDVLREELLPPGAVTGGFHGLAVVDRSPAPQWRAGTPEPAGVTVVFRWRDDPTAYAVTLPVGISDTGAVTMLEGPAGWPGYQVRGPEDLATEAVSLLMEELDTGLVRRAPRAIERHGSISGDDAAVEGARAEVVHLLLSDGQDVMPGGYFVGTVHLGRNSDAGGHLARVGLDVTAAREALARRRLVTWRHAYVNNERAEPMTGHAALAWEEGSRTGPGGAARLVALQVGAGWPVSVAQALLLHALRDAAEAGAATASVAPEVASGWERVLQEAGFLASRAEGVLALTLVEQLWPVLVT